MPNTYTKIAAVTVGAGGAASLDFSAIPQTYTDLVIKISGRDARAVVASSVVLQVNGSTASSGSYLRIYGDGTSAFSDSSSGDTTVQSGHSNGNSSTANTFGNVEIYIPNYTGSTNKSLSAEGVAETNATTTYMSLVAGLWANTAAITSLSVKPATAVNFLQYTTATLYGVTSSGAGAKATGGVITTDGTYFYHTFTSSGTFTPTANLTADYLVVAGGGGGGANRGGGGGAGGLRCTVGATGGGGSLESALSLTNGTGYTVTIGAGGSGADAGTSTASTNGSNSVFSTITSTGGGAGGKYPVNNPGSSGGSGGGGALGTTTTDAGGAGTANQGYAGGTGGNNSLNGGAIGSGGGGGAGVVGVSVTNTAQGGAGGNGIATVINGTSTYYAGGGAGGSSNTGVRSAGGLGGGGQSGGDGAGDAAAVAGTANSGGGGGATGRNSSFPGASGGSGIVIVRYAV